MKKKGDGFHTPFKDLKLKVPGPASEPKKKPEPVRPAPPPPPSDDEALFYSAMADVAPIRDRGQAPEPPKLHPHVVNEEAESLAQLADFVSGEGPFDISDTHEFIQGGARDLDPRVLRALKRGDYTLQGHLDLHGMSKAEAKEAVDRFLADSRRQGRRCVLIIHGRGLNSRDQIPVLKEAVQSWLNRGKVARSVLAFCSARPHDGGAGAVYVLLRR